MRTGLLYAEPSFVEGLARALDIGGTLEVYNESDRADFLALQADWRTVGDDLRRAVEEAIGERVPEPQLAR